MRRTLLKSKIHRATVTDADLQYEGSISIDPTLADAADFVPFERVEIYNITNGERDSGEITLNGAAAHKVTPGDLVIICTYAEYEETEAHNHTPKLVYVDSDNRILDRRTTAA